MKDNKINFLKEFQGGSMARTFLVSKRSERMVRKVVETSNSALGAEKLKKQFDWLLDFNRKYQGIFPKVDFFVISKGYCHYDMEFIEMPTLRDYIIGTKEIDFTLFNDMLNYGATIAAVDPNHKGNKNTYIKEKHLKKMVERCRVIQNSEIYKSKYIFINGKKLKNLKLLIEEISSNEKLLELLKPKKWYRSHGDFTFQNILTNEEELRIIDPRGEGSDSIYYDLSKLYQSCDGKYDLLYEGNYSCKAYKMVNDDEEEINVDYTIKDNVEKFNNILNLIRELIPDYYNIEDPNWEIATKFFEGSHFISMIPFRIKESEMSATICYAIGIQILNEVLNEWNKIVGGNNDEV